MSQRGRRYPIKSKEAKTVLIRASDMLNMNAVDLFGLQSHIEVIESERIRIFLINGRPLLLQNENVLLPTLLFSEAMGMLPKIIVDMGAVPYVCKGADVMAPGIVRIEGEFERGQLVVVSDEKHGKPLCLGESLVDSENARTIKQGPVIKNLHYVSDKFWQLLKTVGGS